MSKRDAEIKKAYLTQLCASIGGRVPRPAWAAFKVMAAAGPIVALGGVSLMCCSDDGEGDDALGHHIIVGAEYACPPEACGHEPDVPDTDSVAHEASLGMEYACPADLCGPYDKDASDADALGHEAAIGYEYGCPDGTCGSDEDAPEPDATDALPDSEDACLGESCSGEPG